MEKLHLTLVFLGQTDARRVEAIAAATAAVAARRPAYDVVTDLFELLDLLAIERPAVSPA